MCPKKKHKQSDNVHLCCDHQKFYRLLVLASLSQSCVFSTMHLYIKLSQQCIFESTHKYISEFLLFKMPRCWQHDLNFVTEEQLRWHQQFECESMLHTRNVCLYQQGDGKCCRAFFTHTSTLAYHYMITHRQFACTRCYGTFNSVSELEQHSHPDGADYHESE